MSLDYTVITLICVLVLIHLVAILILLERKLLALSQRRIGPTILGKRGILQILADVIKPLFKEIFEQKFQRVTIVAFSIYLLLFSQLLYLTFFSYGIFGVLYDNIDFIIILQVAIGGLSCLSVLLIGYLSSTRYGMIGSIRLILAELSVEASVSLLNSIIILNTSGFDFTSLCCNQGMNPSIYILGIIYSIVYIIHLFVSAQRSPLDLIENEGELVAGYNTEYSGPDVLVIYFAEYLHIINGVLQIIYLLFGFSIFISANYLIIDNFIDFINIL
jgi:NADH-quinone oxidoreductase subunit H